jgi:hypothetical protein
MTAERSATQYARRAGSMAVRVGRASTQLTRERRIAAAAAVGLFATLFLPWYQETLVVAGAHSPQAATATLTGWGAFSFVEAAVLLVAGAVLTLLFQRAEGRAFHVPGGDGGVIAAAGFWTCVLVVWRIFDKQGTSTHGTAVSASGIEWGIFIALAVAATLTWAGMQIRAAHQPEPPLPGEATPPAAPPPPDQGVPVPATAGDTAEQLTIPFEPRARD